MLRLIYFSICLLAFGCAQKPTKTFESYDVNTNILRAHLEKPIRVSDETIIIDARSAFEYAVAHAPQAINMQWSEFANTSGDFLGLIKPDLSADLRRLALMGVHPKSEVVILGLGLSGRGEEGRLAWTLLYLGVENIQVAEADSLSLRYSNIVSPQRANAKPWQPMRRTSILADITEVKKIKSDAQNKRTHILDVRSKDEYFSKNRKLEYEMPDIQAIHVEWKEFYTAQGRPNQAIRERLRAIHIQPSDRIVVISNNGVRSGAVTYALLSLGYKNAANFAGGYSELFNLKSKK